MNLIWIAAIAAIAVNAYNILVFYYKLQPSLRVAKYADGKYMIEKRGLLNPFSWSNEVFPHTRGTVEYNYRYTGKNVYSRRYDTVKEANEVINAHYYYLRNEKLKSTRVSYFKTKPVSKDLGVLIEELKTATGERELEIIEILKKS